MQNPPSLNPPSFAKITPSLQIPYTHQSPVNLLLTPIRATLLALAALASQARSQDVAAPTPTPRPLPRPHRTSPRVPRPPTSTPFNPTVILLDPAHGASDPGAKLSPNLLEKDLTLAFSNRLRTLLTARGFTVLLTRESDPPTPTPQPDQPTPVAPSTVSQEARAELANRAHPVACLLIHATALGHGVHLYTSALTPLSPSSTPLEIIPWDSAQAASIPQSLALDADLAQSLAALRIPLLSSRVSVGPIDSMVCPAVTLELAPPPGSSDPSDAGYNQRIAEAVAAALTAWRDHAVAALPKTAPAPPTVTKPRPPKPKPTPRPPIEPTPAGAAQ